MCQATIDVVPEAESEMDQSMHLVFPESTSFNANDVFIQIRILGQLGQLVRTLWQGEGGL